MKKNIDYLLDCPMCSTKYPKQNVRIVSARQSVILVHMSCNKCKSNSLALLSKNNLAGENLVTMGMLTDLDFEEAVQMIGKEPITADEVLDAREELKTTRML